MRVNEIFFSVQGESTLVGVPTTFVRLTGCNLRCTYCDTKYAYEEGTEMSPQEVVDKIYEVAKSEFVCFTGGEPLMQYDELLQVLEKMRGFVVSIETNGSVEIQQVVNVRKIVMDIKCPSSFTSPTTPAFDEITQKNIMRLNSHDEIKFVVAGEEDIEFAKKWIAKIPRAMMILMSPVFGRITLKELVDRVLSDEVLSKRVRVQCQLHKVIWPPETRGV